MTKSTNDDVDSDDYTPPITGQNSDRSPMTTVASASACRSINSVVTDMCHNLGLEPDSSVPEVVAAWQQKVEPLNDGDTWSKFVYILLESALGRIDDGT